MSSILTAASIITSVRATAAILALALIALGGTPALALDDLAGWQETRWGMTEVQARKAAGTETRTIDPPVNYRFLYAPMKVPLKIGAFPLEALLQFSKETRRLQQVLVRSDSDNPALWTLLRDLLTEKYGAPAQLGDKQEWRFPTTIIELMRVQVPSVRQIHVRYYPATAYRDDKPKL